MLNLLMMFMNTLEFLYPIKDGPPRMLSNNSPLAKEHEILIDITRSSDRFKLSLDDDGNPQLSRGSKIWKAQKLDELEKNMDFLGTVTVNRKGVPTKISDWPFDIYLMKIG